MRLTDEDIYDMIHRKTPEERARDWEALKKRVDDFAERWEDHKRRWGLSQ